MILNLHSLYGTAHNVNYNFLKKLYPLAKIYSPQLAFETLSPNSIETTGTKRLHETSCNTLGKDNDVLDSQFTKTYLKNSKIYEIEGTHRISGKEYKRLFKELMYRLKEPGQL